MTDTIVDYSAGVPSAAAIKAAGHVGAARYISPARPGATSWMHGKPMRRAEADALKAHGLEIVSIWQHLKEDWRHGVAGGYEDGLAAIKGHRAAGGPEGCVIYAAIDSNPTESEWNGTAKPYVIGFREALREQGFRIGIYCNTKCHRWADRDGIPHFWWAHNWGSDGTTSQAHIFQFEIDKKSIEGVGIDRNYVQHDDYGQWSKATGEVKEVVPVTAPPRDTVNLDNIKLKPNPNHRGDPHFLPDVLRAFGVTVKEMDGWDVWGMGDFNKIWGVGAHHTGANNTSAGYIARNAGLAGGLSSQIHLSRTAPFVATLCGVGIAWHMGKGSYPGLPTNNANPLLIGIEPQSNGTDAWPEGMLDIYYRIVAAILWYLGLDASRCISHWEYSLVAQGKWDPGAGNGTSGAVMDMDHFRARVQHYIDNPPFMEGISTMALDLNKRYKSRAPEGYYEGAPYEGTIEDFWLNTDTHAWVARVNTERILQQQQKQHEERAAIDRELAQSISSLADAIRG